MDDNRQTTLLEATPFQIQVEFETRAIAALKKRFRHTIVTVAALVIVAVVSGVIYNFD